MAPIKSSLAKSATKLLGVFRDRDLSLRGFKSSSRLPRFVASGGTKIDSGSDVYHVFTADTPSPQSSLVVVGGSVSVEVLVVAGGGGGATQHGGGGGAGGVLHHPGFTVTDGTYPVTVGSAGALGLVGPGPGNATGTYAGSGGNSYFGPPSTPNGFTADGGGGGFPLGRNGSNPPQPLAYDNAPPGSSPYQGAGHPGGSGGGTGDEPGKPGGASTQNPMNGATGYGNKGGDASGAPGYNSGGGGGAGSAGQDGAPSSGNGNGGNGQPFTNFPAPVLAPAIPSPNRTAWTNAVGPTGLFGGGGGRGSEGPSSNGDSNGPGNGGPGGGGTGGAGGNPGTTGSSGVYGTGGGGGGSSGYQAPGAAGGSGIVIIRYQPS